jgi:hypothetical protein
MCDQYGSVGRAEAIVHIYFTDVQEAEVQHAEKGLSSINMVFCGSLEIFHLGGPSVCAPPVSLGGCRSDANLPVKS